jgi:phosphohistidine phosphatase
VTLTLLVLRHAHAASSRGTPDEERPLSRRGTGEAARVGARVRAEQPQVVLCSSARRTRQTLAALELPSATVVDIDQQIYLADADTLLEAVRGMGALADEPSTALVVAHNPGAHDLVVELTGGAGLPGFPPAALAVVDLDVDAWWQVDSAAGSLRSLVLPAS